jgi:hypothetical protein
MSKRGVPFNLFRESQRVSMLMSFPNSVGIDPASVNEDVLKQVVDSCYQTRQREQTGAYRSIRCSKEKGASC